MVCNIGNWRARRDHAKPRVEGSEFAQKRSQGRLGLPVLLVDQADFGAAPGHREPAGFDDPQQASLTFRPFPMLFQDVDPGRQTK